MNISAQSFYKVVGTVGNDYARNVINDVDSGYVIVGATEGIGQGGMDGYLMKLDTAGELQYTRTFGGEEIDWLTDIKRIPTGFVISGYSNSFGLDYDAYLIQTDLNGITVWESLVGGDSWDFANSIGIMPDGNYIIAGESYSFSNGESDGFVAKVNTMGDTLWTKHFGGLKKDWFNDIAVNEYGEIGLCGVATNDIDETDFWVMKLDLDGNLLWDLALGDTLDDEGQSIVFMENGDIEVTGFNTFDNSSTKSAFHYRIDSAGNVIHGEGFYGPAEDFGMAITAYQNTDQCIVALGTSSYGLGGIDVYVDELNSIMLPTYDKHYSFGTQGHEIPMGIDTTYDKGVVVVGNTNLTQNGSNSIFINKTDSLAVVDETYEEALDLAVSNNVDATQKIWPNPVNKVLHINTTNMESYEIYSLNGSKVAEGQFNQSIINIDLPPGLYFLKMQSSLVFKIVVE